MPWTLVNGTHLYHEEAGAGPALLFLHGAVTDAGTWTGQVARLSASFRCIAYDRRGSSRSPWTEPAGDPREVDAADAAALIELLGAAPCVVVATSAGGRVALELMLRYPHLVAGAVLSEPAVFELDPGDHTAFDRSVQEAFEGPLLAGDPRAAVEAFARVIDPREWAATTEDERAARRGNHAALQRLAASTPPPMTRDDLARVGVPCAIVTGAETHGVFRRIAESLAASLSGATLVCLSGCGHQTYAARPEAFARIVRTFALSAHDGAAAPLRAG
jgi:pimeloyl-ACP methyl ester carboxylesterase